MSSPAHRHRVAVLAVVLVGMLVAATPQPASATPFGVQMRAMQYNVCQVACHPYVANPPSRDVALYAIVSESPHTVSINEICQYDAFKLAGQAGISIPAWYHAANRPECPLYQGRRSFGNAAYVAGTSPRYGYAKQFPEADQHPNDLGKTYPERRGMACAWAQSYVGRIVSCSSHLTNQNDAWAEDQANVYAFLFAVDSNTGNQPVSVLGGDFNVTPGGGYLPPVYATSFHRIFTNYTHSTSSLSQTIDYMHVENPNYNGQVEAAGSNRSCNSAASDHCLIYGTYY